jgi:hypothetical protein
MHSSLAYAEKYVLIQKISGQDYYYDKDSIYDVGNGIKEVWDVSANVKSISKRQVRIDCINNKYALGEAIAWMGGKEIAHLYFNKNGWIWTGVKGSLNNKLFNAVCRSK